MPSIGELSHMWTIGKLASRAKVSVRTLRHYDDIGLLSPATRSAAGYRLYGKPEAIRLVLITTLRAMGMSLKDIQMQLQGERIDLAAAIRVQRGYLDSERRRLASIERKLNAVDQCLQQADDHSGIVQLLELLPMFENYYTEEQLETLRQRAGELGQDTIESVQNEWPELIAKVRAARAAGKPPEDPEVQKLAARWQELVLMFTGGDAGITQSLANMYQSEPNAASTAGFDAELGAFVASALNQSR